VGRFVFVEARANGYSPPLRTAPVFTGIAGLMTGDQVDSEEVGSMPAVTSKTREAGDELKELYRRTLAAGWTCQPGELSADKCIEDIFAGGDGWGEATGERRPITQLGKHAPEDLGSLSDSSARHFSGTRRNNWQSFFRSSRQDMKRASRESLGKREDRPRHVSTGGVRGRGSFEQQAHQLTSDAERGNSRPPHELDEFDLRDDLRSWKIRT
jgi:hypothetical protein